MNYKLPYLLGGGFTNDLAAATAAHVHCMSSCLQAIALTQRLIAIADEQLDLHNPDEAVARATILIDCLRSRLESELEVLTDSIQLLETFYSE